MVAYIAHHKSGTIAGKVARECINTLRVAFEAKGYRFEVIV